MIYYNSKHRESDVQIACVRWFSLEYPNLAPMLVHIPNEGFAGGRVTGAIRKGMGVKAGFPDLFLFLKRGGYGGLAIEMKTDSKTSRMRPNQKVYKQRLEDAGYAHAVVRNIDEFITTINGYLKQ